MLSLSPRPAPFPHISYTSNDYRIYMEFFECKEYFMNNFARTGAGLGNQKAMVTLVIPKPFLL